LIEQDKKRQVFFVVVVVNALLGFVFNRVIFCFLFTNEAYRWLNDLPKRNFRKFLNHKYFVTWPLLRTLEALGGFFVRARK